jgi:flagellar biosynthesis protein FlhG
VREKLQQIIETVAPRFDRILLDTGAGISDVVLYAVSLAAEVMVVATTEPTSLTDAYATIKVLATQQHRSKLLLVVNQVGKAGEGRIVRGQLQQVVDRFVVPLMPAGSPALKLELMGEIPIDSAVREAVQKRQLLLETLPGCAAAKGISAIAAKLGENQ